MNRIDALLHAYEDDTRPASERDYALAALRSLITDGSDSVERQRAQAAVDSLAPKPPLTEAEKRAVDLCGPLGLDLLRFAGAHEISEVTWRDLIRFTDSRDWPGKWDYPDVKRLWIGWMVWGNGGINFVASFRDRILSAINEQFATDRERRAEFERLDHEYPLFGLSAADDPY